LIAKTLNARELVGREKIRSDGALSFKKRNTGKMIYVDDRKEVLI
jgi:hypothetical protein